MVVENLCLKKILNFSFLKITKNQIKIADRKNAKDMAHDESPNLSFKGIKYAINAPIITNGMVSSIVRIIDPLKAKKMG